MAKRELTSPVPASRTGGSGAPSSGAAGDRLELWRALLREYVAGTR